MCGANLDVGAKSAEPEVPEKRPSGRVRQRTMSRTQEELSTTAQKIREEIGGLGQPGGLSAAMLGAGVADSDSGQSVEDPLSAYIEELDTEPATQTNVPAATDSLGGSGSFSADSYNHDVLEADSKTTAIPGHHGERSLSPVLGSNGVTDSVGEYDTPAPKPIEETRQSRGSGVNFGDKREERPATPIEGGPDASRKSSAPTRSEAPKQVAQADRGRNGEQRFGRDDDSRSDRRDSRSDRGERDRLEREEDKGGFHRPPSSEKVENDKPRSIEVPRRNVNSGGRLAGWLVSYREADGRAIELREGKFFISRSRVKDSDLVIDDKSVSTPHALCAIGNDTKMRLQDLMSDEGVFVRRRGESDFVRITETAELEHGDWVRFGAVEYNVCLVAHVGVK